MTEPITRHPIFTENIQDELITAQSDVKWKRAAYKAAAWGYWALAGAVVLGIIVTSVLTPALIPNHIALALAPTGMLIFALKETRTLYDHNVVSPRLAKYRQALLKLNELTALADLQATHSTDSPIRLRERYYRTLSETAQIEANQLFQDRVNRSDFLKGYQKEECIALAAKVHAAAMLYLQRNPHDTRPLEAIIPIQYQRYDERVVSTGQEFGGNYLPGISRSDVRFQSIEQLASRMTAA